MTAPRFTACVVLVVALAWTSGTVYAQTTEAERAALARALFDEGLGLADRDQLDEAADRFRRAYDLRPAPAIAFNLASALARSGHVVEASELLRRVGRDAASPPDLRATARALLEQTAPRVARLEVRLTGHVEGARVTLDGGELSAAALGIAAPTDPGHHVIAVHRGDEVAASREIELAEGQSSAVELTVPPPPSSEHEARRAPAAALRVAPRARASRDDDAEGSSVLESWWFWTAAGLVVAGGAVATWLILSPEPDDPIPGTTQPAVLVWR